MKHTTRRDGGRDEPRPEQLHPKGDIRPPLFPEKIETLENLLDAKTRERVGRVVLYGDQGQLSWPLMYSSVLAQYLPRNFPNAGFIDFTGLMRLVKVSGRQDLTTQREDIELWSATGAAGSLRDGTVTFYPSRGITRGAIKVCGDAGALTLYLPDFGHSNAGRVVAYNPGGRVEETLGEAFGGIQSLKDAQVQVLKRLGLDALPEVGEHAILSPGEYSIELKQAIVEMRRRLDANADGRPVVLVNAGKAETRETPDNIMEVHSELAGLVRDLDAAYVVNMGAAGQNQHLSSQSRELFNTLQAAGGGRVFQLGEFDVTHLAALMLACDETGGCMVDLWGGPSLLADWLGAREAVIKLPGWDWMIRERDNTEYIRLDGLDALTPKVKGLIKKHP